MLQMLQFQKYIKKDKIIHFMLQNRKNVTKNVTKKVTNNRRLQFQACFWKVSLRAGKIFFLNILFLKFYYTIFLKKKA